jgi:hypothetical protein
MSDLRNSMVSLGKTV